MFGIFAENYRIWKARSIEADFTQFFTDSDILSRSDMVIYRALLYFNLP